MPKTNPNFQNQGKDKRGKKCEALGGKCCWCGGTESCLWKTGLVRGKVVYRAACMRCWYKHKAEIDAVKAAATATSSARKERPVIELDLEDDKISEETPTHAKASPSEPEDGEGQPDAEADGETVSPAKAPREYKLTEFEQDRRYPIQTPYGSQPYMPTPMVHPYAYPVPYIPPPAIREVHGPTTQRPAPYSLQAQGRNSA
ncbi:uncharacterized protein EV422DRAFT_594217 [Fimicolochytrium jonesii]|uniref:uncharacterized protein n=1 Tax=Fimicolochytrium jonesii TaxID=1396493 RepID=UPI0022FDC354|nr:uncharacterized protein EV422DRAFT_594217 [Fimicolochytrium jonesii]KAI8827178.1 hypothetical protein EV422DRAFT_594217 [Fimicolochytrium jonesii]